MDANVVQSYYNHQPFRVEDLQGSDTEMTQVEVSIDGKPPRLAFLTQHFAQRNQPGDIRLTATPVKT